MKGKAVKWVRGLGEKRKGDEFTNCTNYRFAVAVYVANL